MLNWSLIETHIMTAIDEIKDSEVKDEKVAVADKKTVVFKKGFGSKTLNRRTGQK